MATLSSEVEEISMNLEVEAEEDLISNSEEAVVENIEENIEEASEEEENLEVITEEAEEISEAATGVVAVADNQMSTAQNIEEKVMISNMNRDSRKLIRKHLPILEVDSITNSDASFHV